MIDNHDAFARLEHEINVAGSPLTVALTVRNGVSTRTVFGPTGAQPFIYDIGWYGGAFLSVNSRSKAAVSY